MGELIFQGMLIGMSAVFAAGAMGLALGSLFFGPKPDAKVTDEKRG